MSSKKSKRLRRKHIPQRTCVGCRMVEAKRNLIRIVRQADGVVIDLTGKLEGRGAYLHDKKSCWEQSLVRGTLARALKVELTADDYQRIRSFSETLPE